MADNNYNMVKPVEGLQNIAGLSPTRRRDEREHRQNPSQQQKDNAEQGPNEPVTEEDTNPDTDDDKQDQDHRIDYCA